MSKFDEEYESIKNGYLTAAKVCAMYGDEYLPILERMDKELKEYERRKGLKLLALERLSLTATF